MIVQEIGSFRTVHDLCSGSGEVTMILKDEGNFVISASDPYTFELYQKNTGLLCTRESFLDIAQGKLHGEFDVIICSYSLHLCDKSLLFNVLFDLLSRCKYLIIISPTKRPLISQFVPVKEFCLNRVHTRIFKGF
jgi:hypothetical protein